MNPYRDSEPPPDHPSSPPPDRCDRCGLIVRPLVTAEEERLAPYEASLLRLIAGGQSTWHGTELRCPGPPKLEPPPTWLGALLEWLAS